MIKKSALKYALGAIILLTVISCADQGGRRLPRHSGEPGELLIVMNEKQWLGNLGDSLRVALEAYYPFLPQAEPKYSLLQFSSDEMNGLLRHHRNIIQVTVGPDSEGDNKISLARDRWSNNQLVFSIKAENEEAFFGLMDGEIDQLMATVDRTEIDRTIARYKAHGNDGLEGVVDEKFGVSLSLPLDMELAVEKPDFLWLRRERVKYQGNTAHDITQGLFIYRYPYESEAQFSTDAILAIRDSLLKSYVPGPNENTYMSTEYRLMPESEELEIDNRFGVFTRGLWRTENYFMGGPFVSITTTVKDGSSLLCISGFVFAPKFDKREYIREMEAILRSARFGKSAD